MAHIVNFQELIATALEHQVTLEKKLSKLRNHLHHRESEELLKNAQDHALRVHHTFLDSCQQLATFAVEPTPQSTALVRKIIEIPELLERVFTFLKVPELLIAMQVNHQTAAAVETSPSLQEKLYLRLNKTGYLCSAFNYRYHFPGTKINGSCEFADLQVRFPGKDHRAWSILPPPWTGCAVQAVFAGPFRKLPRIGERCRRILIFQPPIREMRVYVNCCRWIPYRNHEDFSVTDNSHIGRPHTQTTSDTGLTVGDLYDMTAKLRKAHRSYVEVSFEGTVPLQPDDPFLDDVAGRKAELETAENTSSNRWALMRAFGNSKRMAHIRGEAIPTFEEFSADFEKLIANADSENTLEAARPLASVD